MESRTERCPSSANRHHLGTLFSCWGPPPGPPTVSAAVVDMEEESLVAEQGVGIVQFEQINALSRVVMAPSLDFTVTVLAEHLHDLSIATTQAVYGSSLYVSLPAVP